MQESTKKDSQKNESLIDKNFPFIPEGWKNKAERLEKSICEMTIYLESYLYTKLDAIKEEGMLEVIRQASEYWTFCENGYLDMLSIMKAMTAIEMLYNDIECFQIERQQNDKN